MPTIPHVPGLPYIGSAFVFAANPLRYMYRQFDKHGSTFLLTLLGERVYVTRDPEVFRFALQTNQREFVKDRGYEALKMVLGEGLVTSEGDFWRKQRRIVQPVFYKKSLHQLYDAMVLETNKYVRELRDRIPNEPVIDVSEEMMGVTANIVLQTLFSSEHDEDQREMYHLINDAQHYMVGVVRQPYLHPWRVVSGQRRRFNDVRRRVDSLIYNLIEERRRSGELKHDLLDLLLHATDETTGGAMSDTQVRDEAVTLFAAGHETSANALSWTLYLLSQHPEVVARLREEADRVVGDGEHPDATQIRQMPYSAQVIEEGMRLYPPAWALGRRLVEDTTIDGKHYKGDSIFLMSVHGLHRNPDLWNDPDAFRPERFSTDAVRMRPKGHYIPFGAGPRMCIGYHFAMMEMQLLLVQLIRNFDFELVAEQRVEPQPLIALKPKYGIKMRVRALSLHHHREAVSER